MNVKHALKANELSGYLFIAMLAILASCSPSRKGQGKTEGSMVAVQLDLQTVKDDKVKVEVTAPPISSDKVTFQFPRVIPGTYSIANYGKSIENFQAFDVSGAALPVVKKDVNTWEISSASKLSRVSYWVNDTYDSEGQSVFSEGSETIFSPAGTNILAGKQFMLNLCGFVGYFGDKADLPYQITIKHPKNLTGVSSLNDENASDEIDVFRTNRYASVVDNPIMYAEPDIAGSQIGNMKVQLSVYSPRNKRITANALYPDLEKMMKAQKNYLGSINNTPKYVVLTYISSMAKDDAQGMGALEHNTSTTATFQESMQVKDLIHVISHEFFHTLTPLNVHSKEIHYFDFKDPKMSQHLWFYEGITEYFSNHFQVHEGLINETKFYSMLAAKEDNSKKLFKDDLSFTQMSKNVLDPKMKAQYQNVYEKGALIAMCLDIMLREQSNGKTGLLHLMGELSKKYGPERPFDDDELIPVITSMTSPAVGSFLKTHVVDGTPIDYAAMLSKVGVTRATVQVPEMIAYIVNGKPYLVLDTVNRKAVIMKHDDNNNFYNSMGLQDKDELIEVNGTPIDASSITNVLLSGYQLEEGQEMTIKVKRNGQLIDLKGKVKLNYKDGAGFKFTDQSKKSLNEAWLRK
jgi:predicted metalloprotease with PDZ domain